MANEMLQSDETTSHKPRTSTGSKPAWFVSALATVDSIAALPSNWDGYGSPPLAENVRQSAIAILKALNRSDVPEPNIVPVSGGGMQLEWFHEGRELELEILAEPRQAVYLMVDEDESMKANAYPVSDFQRTDKLISWLMKDE
jgi:hypothetical protein